MPSANVLRTCAQPAPPSVAPQYRSSCKIFRPETWQNVNFPRQAALSWFVYGHAEIAEWKATVDSLTVFVKEARNAHVEELAGTGFKT